MQHDTIALHDRIVFRHIFRVRFYDRDVTRRAATDKRDRRDDK
jgi:hypothetical protein